MGWATTFLTDTVDSGAPGNQGITTVTFEVVPGEVAVIEVIRTDAATEAWRIETQPSIDNSLFSGVSGLRNQYSVNDLDPILTHHWSEGRFFRLVSENKNTPPTDQIEYTVRVLIGIPD